MTGQSLWLFSPPETSDGKLINLSMNRAPIQRQRNENINQIPLNPMRPDMHKVIVERPRYGGGREPHHRRANLPLEDLPLRESMRAAHVDRKSFGENLAPLRRWLRAQVGRRWDEAYGDACAVIKPDSTVRNHIKVHLLEMVERHTFEREGEVWCFRRRWWTPNEVRVTELGGHWGCFYVDPRSGLLREAPPARRVQSWREREAQRLAETCRWLDEQTALLKVKGCWFECGMHPLPENDEWHEFDLAQHRQISGDQAKKCYGKRMFCVAKRQLSQKELRKHGLKN